MTDKNILKELIGQLKSNNEKQVLDALEQFKEDGQASLLQIIVDLYAHSDHKTVREKAFGLLCDLKIQQVDETIVELIKQQEDIEIKKNLIASCWQSRINYIAYLEYFIDLVIDAEFEVAFEAFTVIENIDGKVSFERKQQLISYTEDILQDALEQNAVLAADIPGIIDQYEEP
jgi:hypothetical protein